jgi:hypothetical protein
MSKIIDYSNTIIYKITCKNKNITDVYVGHTTNFVQRKHAHKQSCINNKSPNYYCKLYEVIRENGGWANWNMDIINFFNCVNHYEARQKEQEYFIKLNATLNSIEPLPLPKLKTIHKYKKENNIENENVNIKTYKNSVYKYICDNCNFKCDKQSNYNKHLETQKHININNLHTKKQKKYICICGKEYKHKSTLCDHKKKCIIKQTTNNNTIISSETEIQLLTKILSELIKKNTEFQTHMIDLYKKKEENCEAGLNL